MTKKVLHWLGPTQDDLRAFPEEVRKEIGFALYLAQTGDRAPNTLTMSGFGNAGMVEVRAPYDGDTYRAVYTVQFGEALYVLHAFKKKAKSGNATPRRDLELIRHRLSFAESHYNENYVTKRKERRNVGKKR